MKPQYQILYHRVIQTIAVLHIIGGIALPFLAQNAWVANFLVQEMFPGFVLSGDLHGHAAYMVSLFGPTVASWGVLLFVLANSYFSEPTQQKWWGLLIAVLLWFIGDSSYSAINGVFSAVILNSVAAASLLIPIFLSRSLIVKGQ